MVGGGSRVAGGSGDEGEGEETSSLSSSEEEEEAEAAASIRGCLAGADLRRVGGCLGLVGLVEGWGGLKGRPRLGTGLDGGIVFVVGGGGMGGEWDWNGLGGG